MKKGISVLLVLSMLAGIFVTGVAAYENILDDTYTLGDVNGDGVSNALDALEVAKYLAGAEGAQIIRDAGDMNADGQVSAYDALQFRLCLAQARDWAEYESGDALYRFTIGENLVSRYSIVVPADTDPEADNVYMAAQLLQRYVREATGAELPIVFGREEAAYGIVFHVIDENSALGKRLGVEGYIYEVTDGQLNIYGTRRGNMYAVYEIAEEYLGLLFCDSEFAYLYRQRTVDLPEGLYVERVPLLDFRYTGTRVRSNVDDYYFPRRMNGMQLGSAQYFTSRYGTLTGPHFINAHSFGYYYAMATGPADAPTLQERHDQGIMVDEYNWQPCFTSEESYEQMFTGLYLTMRMISEEWGSHKFRVGTSAMSFSICDNTKGYCKCDDCSTIYATNGYAGGSVYIANRAVKDIQEYYPGMKLYFIIYDHVIPQDIFPVEDLIVLFCGTGCNNHFIGSGECGDNLTWELDNAGMLTISGAGDMWEWFTSQTPWIEKNNDIYSVNFEYGVTNVSAWSFYRCDKLKSVYFSNSITAIDYHAFAWCNSLKVVEIPYSVTSIDKQAFYHCESLANINVDENNGTFCSINGVLFDKNKTTLLEYPIGNDRISYTIPESVINIGDYAFSYCTNLTNIEMYNNVTSIGEWAFYNCEYLENITISNNLKNFGECAFRNCKKLTSIVIPYSVTTIANSAFYNCRDLTDVYYLGTKEQWGKITVGSGADELINANIHFLGDEYDIQIGNITADKTARKISADFQNASGAAKTFDAICAVYDERGALITYEDVTVTVSSGETRKIEFFLSASDWDSYKLFAWDDLGSMRPLGWSET